MKFACIFISALFLTACNTQTEPEKSISGAQVKPTYKRLGADEVLSRISVLPPQKLKAGTCGLFLWLRREDAPLLLFQVAGENEAQMVFDGQPVLMQRETAEIPILSWFYEKQRFSAPGFLAQLTIHAERDDKITQGLKVPQGTLSLRTPDGWSASLPVAGVIGCQ